MIVTYASVTQVTDLPVTAKALPPSNWAISTSTPGGGRQSLVIYCAGAVVMKLDLTAAEAALVGSALGGTGGAPVAAAYGQ